MTDSVIAQKEARLIATATLCGGKWTDNQAFCAGMPSRP